MQSLDCFIPRDLQYNTRREAVIREGKKNSPRYYCVIYLSRVSSEFLIWREAPCVRESLMNISHFHAARRRRESVSILHRCRYAAPLQLAAVTFSHTCSPLHLPMIREAFVVPIRAFHHYVSSIALRDERRNMLVKLQSLERYVGHENGTRPPRHPLPRRTECRELFARNM